ncbi:hypothetical protein [Neokomagataea anthophila]|uniref:Uncharacterized protein n=1 Tax=Neokomagataea anthophila TaxID=2826925 RepID=A0ABS5E3S7_9PROT|nr:hypothetical protein [Neokomagataea anthophila]MBR0558562.1 hypothetical protein [Neokomagataea anthophila]
MATAPQKRLFTTEAITLVFAAFWALRGGKAALLPQTPLFILVGLISALLLGSFIARYFYLNLPEQSFDQTLLKRVQIWRGVSLFCVGFLTNATHHTELIYPLIGSIIGLTLIPMARALEEPIHYYSGTIIVLISCFSCLLPAQMHMTLAGLGTATTLWISATIRLARIHTYTTQETVA